MADKQIPPKRKRGRPKKGEGINWTELETAYVTTDQTLARISEVFGVAKGSILAQSTKRGWVRKRKEHKKQVQKEAKQHIAKKQSRSIADEVTDVTALMQGTIRKIALSLQSANYHEVKCDCGRIHRIEMPDGRFTPNDLLVLARLRSHLKGDPEFIVQLDQVVEVQTDLTKLSKTELETLLKEAVVEAEAIVLG